MICGGIICFLKSPSVVFPPSIIHPQTRRTPACSLWQTIPPKRDDFCQVRSSETHYILLFRVINQHGERTFLQNNSIKHGSTFPPRGCSRLWPQELPLFPSNISLKWLISSMNNVNCHWACSGICVIWVLFVADVLGESGRGVKCRYNSFSRKAETQPSRLCTFSSLGVCQPSALNYISHQKCCQRQFYVSLLWSICWCRGILNLRWWWNYLTGCYC